MKGKSTNLASLKSAAFCHKVLCLIMAIALVTLMIPNGLRAHAENEEAMQTQDEQVIQEESQEQDAVPAEEIAEGGETPATEFNADWTLYLGTSPSYGGFGHWEDDAGNTITNITVHDGWYVYFTERTQVTEPVWICDPSYIQYTLYWIQDDEYAFSCYSFNDSIVTSDQIFISGDSTLNAVVGAPAGYTISLAEEGDGNGHFEKVGSTGTPVTSIDVQEGTFIQTFDDGTFAFTGTTLGNYKFVPDEDGSQFDYWDPSYPTAQAITGNLELTAHTSKLITVTFYAGTVDQISDGARIASIGGDWDWDGATKAFKDFSSSTTRQQMINDFNLHCSVAYDEHILNGWNKAEDVWDFYPTWQQQTYVTLSLGTYPDNSYGYWTVDDEIADSVRVQPGWAVATSDYWNPDEPFYIYDITPTYEQKHVIQWHSLSLFLGFIGWSVNGHALENYYFEINNNTTFNALLSAPVGLSLGTDPDDNYGYWTVDGEIADYVDVYVGQFIYIQEPTNPESIIEIQDLYYGGYYTWHYLQWHATTDDFDFYGWSQKLQRDTIVGDTVFKAKVNGPVTINLGTAPDNSYGYWTNEAGDVVTSIKAYMGQYRKISGDYLYIQEKNAQGGYDTVSTYKWNQAGDYKKWGWNVIMSSTLIDGDLTINCNVDGPVKLYLGTDPDDSYGYWTNNGTRIESEYIEVRLGWYLYFYNESSATTTIEVDDTSTFQPTGNNLQWHANSGSPAFVRWNVLNQLDEDGGMRISENMTLCPVLNTPAEFPKLNFDVEVPYGYSKSDVRLEYSKDNDNYRNITLGEPLSLFEGAGYFNSGRSPMSISNNDFSIYWEVKPVVNKGIPLEFDHWEPAATTEKHIVTGTESSVAVFKEIPRVNFTLSATSAGGSLYIDNDDVPEIMPNPTTLQLYEGSSYTVDGPLMTIYNYDHSVYTYVTAVPWPEAYTFNRWDKQTRFGPYVIQDGDSNFAIFDPVDTTVNLTLYAGENGHLEIMTEETGWEFVSLPPEYTIEKLPQGSYYYNTGKEMHIYTPGADGDPYTEDDVYYAEVKPVGDNLFKFDKWLVTSEGMEAHEILTHDYNIAYFTEDYPTLTFYTQVPLGFSSADVLLRLNKDYFSPSWETITTGQKVPLFYDAYCYTDEGYDMELYDQSVDNYWWVHASVLDGAPLELDHWETELGDDGEHKVNGDEVVTAVFKAKPCYVDLNVVGSGEVVQFNNCNYQTGEIIDEDINYIQLAQGYTLWYDRDDPKLATNEIAYGYTGAYGYFYPIGKIQCVVAEGSQFSLWDPSYKILDSATFDLTAHVESIMYTITFGIAEDGYAAIYDESISDYVEVSIWDVPHGANWGIYTDWMIGDEVFYVEKGNYGDDNYYYQEFFGMTYKYWAYCDGWTFEDGPEADEPITSDFTATPEFFVYTTHEVTFSIPDGHGAVYPVYDEPYKVETLEIPEGVEFYCEWDDFWGNWNIVFETGDYDVYYIQPDDGYQCISISPDSGTVDDDTIIELQFVPEYCTITFGETEDGYAAIYDESTYDYVKVSNWDVPYGASWGIYTDWYYEDEVFYVEKGNYGDDDYYYQEFFGMPYGDWAYCQDWDVDWEYDVPITDDFTATPDFYVYTTHEVEFYLPDGHGKIYDYYTDDEITEPIVVPEGYAFLTEWDEYWNCWNIIFESGDVVYVWPDRGYECASIDPDWGYIEDDMEITIKFQTIPEYRTITFEDSDYGYVGDWYGDGVDSLNVPDGAVWGTYVDRYGDLVFYVEYGEYGDEDFFHEELYAYSYYAGADILSWTVDPDYEVISFDVTVTPNFKEIPLTVVNFETVGKGAVYDYWYEEAVDSVTVPTGSYYEVYYDDYDGMVEVWIDDGSYFTQYFYAFPEYGNKFVGWDPEEGEYGYLEDDEFTFTAYFEQAEMYTVNIDTRGNGSLYDYYHDRNLIDYAFSAPADSWYYFDEDWLVIQNPWDPMYPLEFYPYVPADKDGSFIGWSAPEEEGTIQGPITFEAQFAVNISGTVYADSQPVEGAEILFVEDETNDGYKIQDISDSEGHYNLLIPSGESGTLYVSKDGYNLWEKYLSSDYTSESHNNLNPFLNLEIKHTLSFDTEGGYGTFVNSDKTPITEMEVPDGAVIFGYTSTSPTIQIWSDATWTEMLDEITFIPDGGYAFDTWSTTYQVLEDDYTLYANCHKIIEKVTISGTVAHAEDIPVAGAVVAFISDDFTRQTIELSDFDGSYSIVVEKGCAGRLVVYDEDCQFYIHHFDSQDLTEDVAFDVYLKDYVYVTINPTDPAAHGTFDCVYTIDGYVEEEWSDETYFDYFDDATYFSFDENGVITFGYDNPLGVYEEVVVTPVPLVDYKFDSYVDLDTGVALEPGEFYELYYDDGDLNLGINYASTIVPPQPPQPGGGGLAETGDVATAAVAGLAIIALISCAYVVRRRVKLNK